MTTQDIIDHLKAGRPLTKNVAKEIIRELERVKELEEALTEGEIHERINKALEATCSKQ